MGKNVICFSLWGDSNLYTSGAVANVPEALEIYPGWVCRFYVMDGCPAINDLRLTQCEIVIMPNIYKMYEPEFWRFYAASDDDVDYIFRDCDSRVNSKEAAAVKAWIASGKSAHIMKDSPEHNKQTIMAGMWGIRGGIIKNMKELAERWIATHNMTYKYTDQQFLREIIWPMINGSVLIHGSKHTPYPPYPPMKFGEYIGQVINSWKP